MKINFKFWHQIQIQRMAGKMKGQGKSQGAKRHMKRPEKHGGMHITTGDVRRLARRGGVKRVSSEIYPTARYNNPLRV